MSSKQFKVGYRVGHIYNEFTEGVVFQIDSDYSITVKRDDGFGHDGSPRVLGYKGSDLWFCLPHYLVLLKRIKRKVV